MENNLAANAAARKERLIALRRRKEGKEAGETNGNGEPSHFAFKQRNYDPETRTLRKRGQEDENEDTVEKAVEGLAEQIIKEDEEKRKEELDLFNIQPRRANWDLKRDMTNRMSKLDRKTNEAIATIFRQRLQSMKKDQKGDIDLLASMNAQEHERDDALEANEDSDDE
ncbi:uncharacterized protein I303_107778 [Kwoniella dejecticola CBS 10117]|uniref:Coiled-coil domain-containing protein 12 n=1 Tax=Kwoniella dejecticola CBS 10117 TaxID=1296121 RepID=A0A1A5ZVN5_9TREE|nr:coiled-coil domain-containing protein 12 [Kwoniella dejecticola CBS 10117]OBR81873.1 coiled-coil domain-containing protein 12 [Kwoniella dejecticola CBS 10117]